MGNHLYTTLKNPFGALPAIPERTSHSPGKPILPEFKFLWDSNEFPFLAVVPLHQPFSGPLFRRLSFITSTVPVTEVADGYTLDIDLKTELVTLERNLHAVLHAMLERTGPITSSFQLWAFPARFGYLKTYRTKGAVKVVASRSRDAFVLLMAAVSLALGILRHREELGLEWREAILEKSGVHPQWLSSLEESVVGDFSIPRIGCVVDLTTCDHFELLPIYDKMNMGICLYWGTKTTFSDLRITVLAENFLKSKNCFMDSNIVAHLLPAPSTSLSASSSTITISAPPSGTTSSHLPTSSSNAAPLPEPCSRQKQGETWAMFFARRKVTNDKWQASETPQQKLSRSQREQNAARGQPPGKKGSRVYIWEDVDGFRIRRAAGRGRYSWLWESYARDQRRYDSFNDEWDICTEFGDGTDNPNSGDDYDDFIDATQSPQDGDEIHDDIPTELLPHDELQYFQRDGKYSSNADLGRLFESSELEETALSDASSRDLDNIAYYHYGYVVPVVPVPPHPSVSLEWKVVREYLGDGHWPARLFYPDPSPISIEGITSFFTYLKASNDIEDIPVELYDIRQETSDVRTAAASVTVRKENFNGTSYYIIQTTQSAPFEIGLTDAALVLELVRSDAVKEVFEMCECLLNVGASFRTFIRGPRHAQMYPTLRPHLHGGLGFRPRGYVPDVNDYNAYVAHRDHLFSSFIGRASLLAGGIVARLAYSTVRFESVYFGPSDDVFDFGSCFCSDSPFGYWDDCLTENDTDVICGVYRVGTNQRHGDASQTTDLSWWPKPSVWNSCGLYVGFWSKDCEQWFQDRLTKCLAGTADLKNSKEWRHSLRYLKDVPRMASKNGILASKAIDTFFL
ncbi:hypothetical protein H0H93_002305 [Arthromyces matolae]|nr:hypothetical protein H0H93_002305 [Arthromyces matolae]